MGNNKILLWASEILIEKKIFNKKYKTIINISGDNEIIPSEDSTLKKININSAIIGTTCLKDTGIIFEYKKGIIAHFPFL